MSSTLSDSGNGDDWAGDRDALADILAFHLEAGVDVALGEEPVDRFAESQAARGAGPPLAAQEPPRTAAAAPAPPARRAPA
ncbi:uracil-DNA glycosylase, partial [Ancylobacter aquaticus]